MVYIIKNKEPTGLRSADACGSEESTPEELGSLAAQRLLAEIDLDGVATH